MRAATPHLTLRYRGRSRCTARGPRGPWPVAMPPTGPRAQQAGTRFDRPRRRVPTAARLPLPCVQRQLPFSIVSHPIWRINIWRCARRLGAGRCLVDLPSRPGVPTSDHASTSAAPRYAARRTCHVSPTHLLYIRCGMRHTPRHIGFENTGITINGFEQPQGLPDSKASAAAQIDCRRWHSCSSGVRHRTTGGGGVRGEKSNARHVRRSSCGGDLSMA